MARTRLAAMQEIDRDRGATVEYGPADKPLNSTILAAKIKETDELQTVYNQSLAKAGEDKNEFEKHEKELARMSSGVLSSAKTVFGVDASEIETLGGTRLSERKRSSRKSAAATAAK